MTADGGDACRANIAYAAKLFSSVDVRDMYLDRRDLGCLQGIEKRDARIAVLEVQVSEQVKRSDKFDADIDNFKVLLSDIRSDVSFIRGKMEVGNGVGFGK